MAYKVQMTESADKDLEEIADYIAIKLSNPKSATELLDEFLEKKKLLVKSPLIYPLCSNLRLQEEGYHRFLFKNNFIALYLINKDNKIVTIMRIFYAKRDYEKLI